MRTLIVDDEPLARDGMRLALDAESDVEIVGECASATETREAIAALRPDLVFLDISLPDESGVAVAAQLDPATAPLVVFVTAYEAHAVRAFELHAVDYVLKPLQPARLAAAVARVRATLAARARDAAHVRLAAALAELTRGAGTAPAVPASAANPPAPLDRVTVRIGRRMVVVRLADVEWIAADGDYVRLHGAGGAPLLRATLSDLADRVDPRRFLRVHRSAMVNVDAVRGMQLEEHGDYALVLRSGTKVRVGRAHRPAVLAAFGAVLPPP